MSNKLITLSEADFLKKLAVDMYNQKSGKNYHYRDFCVMSIPPVMGCKYGYEVVTVREDDFLRLRMYFNLTHQQRFRPYSIEVTAPYSNTDLNDEILVTVGEVESYYLDCGAYKFREINTCGVNNLITEDGDDFITEDGDDIVLE